MLAAKTFFETPVPQLSPEMEQDFFSSIMTRNKTYKTTFHQRFADINPVLLQQFESEGRKKARILDIGISSGVSTIELYDDLRAGGLDVTIVATDILIDAFLVRVLPGCHILVDHDGFPLRIDLPWGTMKPWVVRSDYHNGFFILRKAINTWFTHRARRLLLNPGNQGVTAVKLVTPRLLANGGIEVRHDDISRYNNELAGKFNFIRAANILNHGYFQENTLSSMVANLGRYLNGTSALLLVVRTHEDNSNNGTLFRLGEDHRFAVVRRFGGGSEIENIVCSRQCS